MFRISYWVLPIIAGVVWLAMLLTMLLYWIYGTNSMVYSSMASGQKVAYISDIGADTLKPLFITGCAITAIFFDLSFISDRWLRYRGRLVPNVTRTEKILNALTIVFAIVGTVGLVCLAIFDTVRYTQLHRLFLFLFIVGYLLSAIFICWEYQRLGIKYREHRILRRSFWVKLAFIIIEAGLAIAFGATMALSSRSNVAAILEWVVSIIFSFYIFSFVIDLWPAMRTKPQNMRYRKDGMPHPDDSSESANAMEDGLSRYGHGAETRPAAGAGAGADEAVVAPPRAGARTPGTNF